MGPKIPEIKYIHPPYRIEGSPKEARTNFYDFAKKRVKYLSEAEIRKWDTERGGDPPLYILFLLAEAMIRKEIWKNG